MLATATLMAQTPAAINIISGDGQLTCGYCAASDGVNGLPWTHFDPLVIQVVDANGNAVVNTPVTWTVTSGTVYLGPQGSYGPSSSTVTTDNTGKATTQIGQTPALESVSLFVQSTITATAGSVTATFYETQGEPSTQGVSVPAINVSYLNAPLYEPISGVAGSSGGTSFTITVSATTGGAVPDVALMLLNSDYTLGPSPTVPSAYCQTQSGASQYTALTNSLGVATCNVAFGPVAGAGTYYIVTGGTASQTAGALPDTNFLSGALSLSVTAATVGGVKVVSGNNQTGIAGSTLQPLVAEVYDPSAKALEGEVVTWVATPASAIHLNSETTTTDSDGQVKVASPVLSASALGPINVTVTSKSNPAASTSFTITATQAVTTSSLTIQNGNNQTAAENAGFANPLAVLVTGSNGLAMSGVTVSFASSGPVSLSASSTTTNSAGVAQVMATAGTTAGTATVTATIGALSQVFSLTVLAPGPNLTAANFVNGADGQVGSISPCSIAAIVGAGVAPAGAGMPPVVGPLPYEVATDMVSFGTGSAAISAPIFSVSNVIGQQRILFQVPCEVTPGTVPATVTVGGASQTLNVNVLAASPGIFQMVMSDGVVRAVIERPDGSFVNISNPGRRGEIDMAFVTGLGPVSPQVATNALPILYTPSTVDTSQVTVGVDNNGVPVIQAELSLDMIGVYTVQFQVPSDAPQGNNIAFSVAFSPAGAASRLYSAPSSMPIE